MKANKIYCSVMSTPFTIYLAPYHELYGKIDIDYSYLPNLIIRNSTDCDFQMFLLHFKPEIICHKINNIETVCNMTWQTAGNKRNTIRLVEISLLVSFGRQNFSLHNNICSIVACNIRIQLLIFPQFICNWVKATNDAQESKWANNIIIGV